MGTAGERRQQRAPVRSRRAFRGHVYFGPAVSRRQGIFLSPAAAFSREPRTPTQAVTDSLPATAVRSPAEMTNASDLPEIAHAEGSVAYASDGRRYTDL